MKQDKKQTAVDWLFLMLNNPNSDQEFANKLLQKAKQIEKDQIIFTKVSSCNSQNCEKPFKEKLKCSCGPYFYDKTFN
jgi:hypothetical protein